MSEAKEASKQNWGKERQDLQGERRTVNVSVRFTIEQLNLLAAATWSREGNMGQVIRDAVDDYFVKKLQDPQFQKTIDDYTEWQSTLLPHLPSGQSLT